MKKDKFIKDLKTLINEKIASVFIVSKIILKQAKSRKSGSADEAYCLLKLQDKSGLIDAIIWPDVYRKFKELLDPEGKEPQDKELQNAESRTELKEEKLKEEDCVEVEGIISEYRGDLQIVISSIKRADSSEIDYSCFIRSLPEENKQNLVLDLEKIPEKKDQSALPHFTKNDDNYELSGGVNNIIRVMIEFALHNTGINFYYGSPSQIMATLVYRYKCSPDNGKFNAEIKKVKNFEDFDLSVLSKDINITGFGYYADNYNVLEQILKKFYAMEISVRNVQRLIYGEIAPLQSIYESIIAGFRQDSSTSSLNSADCGTVDSTVGSDNTKTGKDVFGNSPEILGPDVNDIINSNNTLHGSGRFSIGCKAEAGSETLPGSGFVGGQGKNDDVNNKNIRLYDELKLANRFKDEEIRYIIGVLKKEIINIGSKYFITLDNSIEFKKANNVITLTVNLKQKD